jgi:hypothetical protein
LSRPILAEFRAQFVQYLCATGYLAAAAFQPLQFHQRIAARQRCQPLQKFLDPVGPQWHAISAI